VGLDVVGLDVGFDVVGFVVVGLEVVGLDVVGLVVVGVAAVGQSSKVISHLVRGPTSAATESIKASVQVPDGMEYKSAKLATLDLYPVGPLFKLPVAMKVPVKGATPVLNAIVP